MSSYVVRVTDPETGDDYTVFRALPDARSYFIQTDELNARYLYEVTLDNNPRVAVAAVKIGHATILDKDLGKRERRKRLVEELMRDGLPMMPKSAAARRRIP